MKLTIKFLENLLKFTFSVDKIISDRNTVNHPIKLLPTISQYLNFKNSAKISIKNVKKMNSHDWVVLGFWRIL